MLSLNIGGREETRAILFVLFFIKAWSSSTLPANHQNTMATDEARSWITLPFGRILFSPWCLHFNDESQTCAVSMWAMVHVKNVTSKPLHWTCETGSPQVHTRNEFFAVDLNAQSGLGSRYFSAVQVLI